MTVLQSDRTGSRIRTILWLVGLALGVRLIVLVVATAFGPVDSIGDLAFHSRLIADPIGHLRDAPDNLAQFAPYLGILEWVAAKPWLLLGFSDLTALRLGAISWDLLGMVLLLAALNLRYPKWLTFAGLMWALAPIFWPASAYSAQDELIVAAVVSGAILLHLARRPLAAVALATAGLFLAKILILPIVVALLLVTPAARQAKAWLTALGTLGVGALVTWAISGTDGLSQQLGYTEEVIGFSISAWSTLVLHHVFEPVTAIRISIGLALVGVAVTLFLWQRDRLRDDLEGSRLGAALVVASIALLAVSNPEYICVAAPMAIVGCIGLRATMQATLLIAMSSVAWAINFVYYLLRKAYDTTGTMLGLEGFVTPTGRTVRILDATHQVALVLFAYLACVVVWNYVVTPGRTAAKETATADV